MNPDRFEHYRRRCETLPFFEVVVVVRSIYLTQARLTTKISLSFVRRMTILDGYKTLLKFDMRLRLSIPSAVLWKAESMKWQLYLAPFQEVRQWM